MFLTGKTRAVLHSDWAKHCARHIIHAQWRFEWQLSRYPWANGTLGVGNHSRGLRTQRREENLPTRFLKNPPRGCFHLSGLRGELSPSPFCSEFTAATAGSAPGAGSLVSCLFPLGLFTSVEEAFLSLEESSLPFGLATAGSGSGGVMGFSVDVCSNFKHNEALIVARRIYLCAGLRTWENGGFGWHLCFGGVLSEMMKRKNKMNKGVFGYKVTWGVFTSFGKFFSILPARILPSFSWTRIWVIFGESFLLSQSFHVGLNK